MNRPYKIIIALILFLFSFSAFAWDAVGHKIIAQIAWQNLTPQTKKILAPYIRAFPEKHAASLYRTFLEMNIWPDQLKTQGITVFDHWHFTRQGFSDDHSYVLKPDHYNIVWAIPQMQAILENPAASVQAKSFALSFLMHFVGDIHQPLHCISLYDKNYPNGDEGGNLIPIRSPYASNLHELWDRELGAFYSVERYHSPYHHQIYQFAQKVMQEFPPKNFGNEIQNINPSEWAKNSFELAKENAYPMQANAEPSQTYIDHNREIALKQIALAGYRLAYLLNSTEKN